MLPRDSLALAPVLRTTPTAPTEAIGDPRQQAFQRAIAVHLGKTMQGEVLARLADGSFVVKVADTPARMQLPPGAQVGAHVELTLVSLQPRPTFQVGAQAFSEAGPAPSEGEAGPGHQPLSFHEGALPEGVSARALARAGQLAASLAPPLHGFEPHTGQGATLSATGQALGTVLGAAMKAEQHASAVTGGAPVLPAPSMEPAVIAPALQQALSKSGLFYEAHVAEWAQGQRPLAELAGEPQMQKTPGALTDPATADFISLQLATQEQAQASWQGQLWPGQHMQWQVGKDDGHGQGAADGGDAPERWQSKLRLAFPQLGELAARIVLSGDRVQVLVDAGDAGSAELLRAHAGMLADAMEAAGTPLAGLAIRNAQAGP